VKRVELEPAFVLHHRAYRETSLIVEILGRDTGRLGLVAKGARRPKSDLRGLLQSFRPLLLSWSGRGELGLLTNAEPDGYVSRLEGTALFSGFYMNELLMRLLHRFDPHPELFDHYKAAVEALGSGKRTESVLRIFEKQMLESIGYGLVLDRDIDSGEPIHVECAYRYQADRGPVSAPEDDGAGDGVHVAGETLLSLARERLEDERVLDEAKRLMRVVLRRYLGDKPLATRTLFRSSGPAQGAR
jgi:DNA repair protein RecO (recombination protein O)